MGLSVAIDGIVNKMAAEFLFCGLIEVALSYFSLSGTLRILAASGAAMSNRYDRGGGGGRGWKRRMPRRSRCSLVVLVESAEPQQHSNSSRLEVDWKVLFAMRPFLPVVPFSDSLV